jgi:hypothetical protein
MKPLVARFLLTVVLFVGWLGFLAYQVATRPVLPDDQPLVLSRPQILTSEVDILAELPAPPPDAEPDGSTKVKVKKVLYGSAVTEGQEIKILNLHECQALVPRGVTVPRDWSKAGEYLIPLVAQKSAGKDTFLVAPIPPSPGYGALGFRLDVRRIYPATAEALAQYHSIAKP